MTETYWKAEHRPPILDRIGKALHKTFDEILHEPMPERWADLINRLNAEENAQRKDDEKETR